jgi:predicted regulator of Ras-like GTPase activity (Roadblock/LC7/MglB family)/predicted  nucleic acid-binding Zn-ribbon protein
MVLLTERSREIADLTAELIRVKTDGLRYLEDAQSTARQLRRANERLAELSSTKHSLSTEHSQLNDELDTLRWELSSARCAANTAETGLSATSVELSKVRQELDAARRTLEAKTGAWDQEREQLKMTVGGLSLEIQNEHQAARVLERRWALTEPKSVPSLAGSDTGKDQSRDSLPVDYRLARVYALEEELENLREERAKLSARLRELEHDAGAAIELEKAQQELRNLQVERQLLERKLEAATLRDEEREALRGNLKDFQQQLRETDGLRAEVERLRAKLYKTPLTSGTFPAAPRVDPLSQGLTTPVDLNHEISEFAENAEVQSAVVADGLGFPVAASGNSMDSDGLAAVAGEADRLSTQARQILGLSEVTQLTLEDRDGMVAHFRYFAVEESIMSIVTLGTQVPNKDDLDRIVGLTRHTLTVPRGGSKPDGYHVGNRPSTTVARPSGTQTVLGLPAELKAKTR